MKLPETVEKALEHLNRSGFEAYVVGGSVRDSLMGLLPKDWDITTSATPDEIKACFAGYHTLDFGAKHGTVTVILDDNPCEITTYRVDGAYSDGRRPDEVMFTGRLKDDLSRRDFTTNAIAYCPKQGIVDYFGGCDDIKARRIACVGVPEERFSEDALRILRAIRFAATLGFTIEATALAAANKLTPLLGGISRERVFAELSKALTGKYTAKALREYASIFSEAVPELKPMSGFNQHTPYHHLNVWEHTVEAVKNAPPDLILRIAILFHDSGKPISFTLDNDRIGHFYGHAAASAQLADTALLRLRCDNATRREAVYLIAHHCDPVKPDVKLLKRQLNRMGAERLGRLIRMKRADCMAQAPAYREERLCCLDETESLLVKIIEENQAFSLKDLAIDGNDLKSAGFASGKMLGETLDTLLQAVIDERVPNEKAALLSEAAKLLRRNRQ